MAQLNLPFFKLLVCCFYLLYEMHLIMGWLNLRWREDTKWRHISSHISTHLLLCYAVAVAINSNCGRVVKLMRWRVSGVLNPGILYYSVGCSIGTMRCVDINGNPILDRRSRFYQECNTGRWSGVMLAPEEKICYLNTLLPPSYCGTMAPQPECTFSGYRCVDSEGIITDTACTSQYVLDWLSHVE